MVLYKTACNFLTYTFCTLWSWAEIMLPGKNLLQNNEERNSCSNSFRKHLWLWGSLLDLIFFSVLLIWIKLVKCLRCLCHLKEECWMWSYNFPPPQSLAVWSLDTDAIADSWLWLFGFILHAWLCWSSHMYMHVLCMLLWNFLLYSFVIPLHTLLCRNRHTVRSQLH